MKESPGDKKLEDMLRSSQMVAGGFMGTDARHPAEVIQEDVDTLARYGLTPEMLAKRMHEFTQLAEPRFGNWIEDPSGHFSAKTEEYCGSLVCPWPHPGKYQKRITTVKNIASGRTISWTDLNIHMIEAHGFFEGKGSFFRIEPIEIAEILFRDLT
jgi:hypothetical protein